MMVETEKMFCEAPFITGRVKCVAKLGNQNYKLKNLTSVFLMHLG